MIDLLFLFAPSGQGEGRAMGAFLVQMVLIIGIIYFLLIRPKVQQEKRHRERISQLKRGDEVVTAGGLVGAVVHIRDDRITVKTGESRVVVHRDRIAEILGAKQGDDAGKKTEGAAKK